MLSENTKLGAAAAAKPAEDREEIILVYIGQRINARGKLIHIWLEVTEEQRQAGETGLSESDLQEDFASWPPRFRIYDGKGVRKHMTAGVGTVYRVPQVKGTSQIYAGESRYDGLWPCDEERFHWQGLSRTATAADGLRRRAGKESKEDDFKELRPLREQYSRLISRDQRAALLAQIITYVTGGK